jgi:hypothetical protein
MKMTKIVTTTDIEFTDLPNTLIEFVELFQNKLEEIPEICRNSAIIDFDDYYLTITWNRPETKEDIKKRCDYEKHLAEVETKNRFKQYLILKEEFENSVIASFQVPKMML